jgi:hypothetical protein
MPTCSRCRVARLDARGTGGGTDHCRRHPEYVAGNARVVRGALGHGWRWSDCRGRLDAQIGPSGIFRAIRADARDGTMNRSNYIYREYPKLLTTPDGLAIVQNIAEERIGCVRYAGRSAGWSAANIGNAACFTHARCRSPRHADNNRAEPRRTASWTPRAHSDTSTRAAASAAAGRLLSIGKRRSDNRHVADPRRWWRRQLNHQPHCL